MNVALKSFERVSRHPDTRMVSVDIFDTLLFRTTLPEKVKFGKFGEEKVKLIQQISPENKINSRYLHLLRLYAATIAYRNRKLVNGAREATLDEIYDVMLSCISADFKIPSEAIETLRQQFRNIELELENNDLSVNSPLKKVLLNAAKAKKKVVAISDMYLSYDDIKQLLKNKGVWDVFDHVYVSSEFGYGKASGFLFDDILTQQKLRPYQATHIGDNWYSDYHIPKQKGVVAFHYPRSFAWRMIHKLRTEISSLFGGTLD